MHADIIQENNLTHTKYSNLSTVSEPTEMKPNLVDKTCKLLKWVCNYTTESYTIPLLQSSYGNIPSCSWPNHSSDVVKWSSRGGANTSVKWDMSVVLRTTTSKSITRRRRNPSVQY